MMMNKIKNQQEMKQTAVDWLVQELSKKGDYGLSFYLEHKDEIIQAKAMEKEQMINAINTVSENNVKYANMIVASWSQIEGELFMNNTKLAEQYYNETFKTNEK
jgi:hypothetical protein